MLLDVQVRLASLKVAQCIKNYLANKSCTRMKVLKKQLNESDIRNVQNKRERCRPFGLLEQIIRRNVCKLSLMECFRQRPVLSGCIKMTSKSILKAGAVAYLSETCHFMSHSTKNVLKGATEGLV